MFDKELVLVEQLCKFANIGCERRSRWIAMKFYSDETNDIFDITWHNSVVEAATFLNIFKHHSNNCILSVDYVFTYNENNEGKRYNVENIVSSSSILWKRYSEFSKDGIFCIYKDFEIYNFETNFGGYLIQKCDNCNKWSLDMNYKGSSCRRKDCFGTYNKSLELADIITNSECQMQHS